jgi:CheY-like chemotaxis protein
MAQENMYELILTDIEMPEMGGLEATKLLREQGYTGKIVAATGRTRPEDKQMCLQAGCAAYVPKPYKIDDIKTMFESLREEPLFSSLADEKDMADLINGFVEELPGKLRAVEEVWVAKNMEQLESLARQIKSEAGGFGYEPISEAASQVELGIQNNADEVHIEAAMEELVRWCKLARGVDAG